MRGQGKALAGAVGKARIRIKPSKVGSLHTALGVPQGQRIPAGKVAAAADSGSANLRKKAQFAQNAAKWGN